MAKREATAGFRNAGWTMGELPEGAHVSVHALRTSDNAAVNGFLYTAGPSEVVACIMHPREFLATHYLVPELLQTGYSVFTQTSRSVGSDLRLEHEIALLDVAAGLKFLTSDRLQEDRPDREFGRREPLYVLQRAVASCPRAAPSADARRTPDRPGQNRDAAGGWRHSRFAPPGSG